MKIILQCDCTGRDGVVQDLTTISLSLESESRYSVLTKTYNEKIPHSFKTQEKANSSINETKESKPKR